MAEVNKSSLNITNARYAASLIGEFYSKVGGRKLRAKNCHINPNGSHVDLIDLNTGQIFHVKFANESFHKFGEFYEGYSNVEGESIDKRVIDLHRDTDLIFFAQPEIIRKSLISDIKQKGIIRRNRADNNTETYSISINELEVFT